MSYEEEDTCHMSRIPWCYATLGSSDSWVFGTLVFTVPLNLRNSGFSPWIFGTLVLRI